MSFGDGQRGLHARSWIDDGGKSGANRWSACRSASLKMSARPIDQLNDLFSRRSGGCAVAGQGNGQVFLFDTLTVGLSGATEPIAQNARDASVNLVMVKSPARWGAG